MKSFPFAPIMLALLIGTPLPAQIWTGSPNEYINQPGNYGTMGVPAATNRPGSRRGAATWTDANGDLWMYGGNGLATSSTTTLLGDMWKYSGGVWTWVGGSTFGYDPPSYGAMGVPAAANTPGARSYACAWTDGGGNLWLFGGCMSVSGSPISGDLWCYSVTTGWWTWISGSSLTGQPGTYGTQGVSSAANMPGARSKASGWRDGTGNIWIFGGSGMAQSSTAGLLNDLWKYDVSSGFWTWMTGSNAVAAGGAYGALGTPNPTNTPGSRYNQESWGSGTNHLFLFGGYGYVSTTLCGYLNDLWKYDVSSGVWTWISGAMDIDQAAVYGTRGVPSASNIPGSRHSCASFTDANGDFWMFGGFGHASAGRGGLNDLWKYSVSGGTWVWVSGSTGIDQPGNWGAPNAQDDTPCGRIGPQGWSTAAGNFVIFGGYKNTGGVLGDLCLFDFTQIPVELASFRAVRQASSVHLAWRTETEAGNAGFAVQRSFTAGGGEWEPRGFVSGAGTSMIAQEYSFIDELPAGTCDGRSIFYRLRQVDVGGAATYSPVVEVFPVASPRGLTILALSPQPAAEGCVATISLPGDDVVSMTLYNVLGGRIMTLQPPTCLSAGTHAIRLRLHDVRPGIYIVHAHGRQQESVRSIVVH